MIPLKTVEELIIRHSSIEKDLSTGGLDNKLFAEKSKEYSDLNEIVGSAKDYISFQTEKEELEKTWRLSSHRSFDRWGRCVLLRTTANLSDNIGCFVDSMHQVFHNRFTLSKGHETSASHRSSSHVDVFWSGLSQCH